MKIRNTGRAEKLNALLDSAGLDPLKDEAATQFEAYLDLILKWNQRLNLTAIRDADQILARHFVESIACAQVLPSGLSSALDLGSGAGFPGIPIAICRLELAVTLAESQGKKAGFLNEAVRVLGLSAKVFSGRAEQLTSTFDCVTLRAVDKMEAATVIACRLTSPGGYLALMTTFPRIQDLVRETDDAVVWREPLALPGSERRALIIGRRK